MPNLSRSSAVAIVLGALGLGGCLLTSDFDNIAGGERAEVDPQASSSSSGGSSGSSSSGSSSSSSSSSGAGLQADASSSEVTVDAVAVTPATGKVGTAAGHVLSFTVSGPLPDTALVLAGPSTTPAGVTEQQLQGSFASIDAPVLDGTKLTMSFTFTPPAAGTYQWTGGFDLDGNTATTDDQVVGLTPADLVVTP